MPARHFVESLEDELPAEGVAAFATITDHYLAERFGAQQGIDLQPELTVLEDAVDRMRLRDQADVR